MKLIATENILKGDVLDTVRIDCVVDGELVVQVRRALGEHLVWPVGIAAENTLWGDPVPYVTKVGFDGRPTNKPGWLQPYKPK